MPLSKEDYINSAKSNAEIIRKEISVLKVSHWSNFERQYKEFWTQVKEINNLFKTLKPLLKEEREELWDNFQSVCSETRNKQNREWESAANNSSNKKSMILSDIRSANNYARGAVSINDLKTANSILRKALDMIKDGWSGFTLTTDLAESILGNNGKMLKNDREECWERWSEAKDNVTAGYDKLSESNYYHFKNEASSAYNDAHNGDPYDVLSKIKIIQSEIKDVFLTKDHRTSIKYLLNNAFDKAVSKIEENKRESQRKHEEWEDKMNSNLERWENTTEKQESFITRMQDQINDLEDKACNARTSEHADRIRGWIEEKYNKIKDAQNSIESLREKIRSVKDKLNN
ncbi:MAG: hypothetical protein ABR980_11630 [Ignavibacteriaceae bacterium]|jgi:Asp-tRNA(Asn)/Glu-tRNA(Gln) amidotransferase C subunit